MKENERPDLASRRVFLAWFTPMCVYFLLFLSISFRPSLLKNSFVVLLVVVLTFVGNLGAFWMLYQAVRYERRAGKYVLLACVPFMFIWYSLVRVPLRKELHGKPEFIR